jgi:hypothetical protein
VRRGQHHRIGESPAVNADLICHFFSEAKCPSVSDLVLSFSVDPTTVPIYKLAGELWAAKRPIYSPQAAPGNWCD